MKESFTFFRAVVVALVVLILGDQLLVAWDDDPLLQYYVVIFASYGGTFYPQDDMVVWCSPGVVLSCRRSKPHYLVLGLSK
jgi:hypothetical protein